MSFYLESCDKRDCFNCTACATICPQKCIEMKFDKKDGYIYPQVEKSRCVNCGMCKKVCINVNNERMQNKIKNAYILYNKDEKTRKNSSSGGISSILMEITIRNNGVVYGACYDKNLNVIHSRAETIEDCEKFKTSKYVRSNIGNIYSQVIKDLSNGRTVLFTGTPCQIAGLKSIAEIKKLDKNLLLCEIMCDSVASPVLFEKFRNQVEKKYNKEIKNINFRSKQNGAHTKSMEITFKDEEKIILPLNKNNLYSEYMQIFGCGLSAPESCSNCQFEHTNERISDFTIGDYWGRKEILEDDNKGISLMLVNSEKGKEIFQREIKERVIYQDVEPLVALNNNHIEPKKNILGKEKFMKDLPLLTFDELAKKYVRKFRWRTKLGKLMPKKLKENIKKIIVKQGKSK